MFKTIPTRWVIFLTIFFSAVCAAESGKISKTDLPVVSVGTAVAKNVSHRVTLFGRLETVSTPTVAAEVSGVLQKIFVDDGAEVTKGQVLASVDVTDYQLAVELSRSELRKKREELAKRIEHFDRVNTLAQTNSVSEDSLAAIARDIAIERIAVEIMENRRKIAKRDLSKANIVSPVNGLVRRRHASTGDYLTVGKPIFELIDHKNLRVRLKISPRDINKVAIGQRVVMLTSEFPEEPQIATVDAIIPVVDSSSNSIDVLVSINNSQWMAGIRVEANIYIHEEYEALTVPARAIYTQGDVKYCFVIDNDTVREQTIEIGVGEEGWVEVVNGLSNTDVVVLDAYRGIKAGDLVRVQGAVR